MWWAGTKEGVGEVAIKRGDPLYLQVAAELRKQIQQGKYPPGSELPGEKELAERFDVSGGVVRSALVQLRSEGLVSTRQGKRAVVREPGTLRRLDSDLSTGRGFYEVLERAGLEPATQTTVTREPADAEVAEWLGIDPGTEVVVRARLQRTEGEPPIGTSVSYFPGWVVQEAPGLADPNVGGTPVNLRKAFGATYSEDLVSARMPSAEERTLLEVPEGVPLVTIRGVTRDAQHRTLHFIRKATVAGRFSYSYRYGSVPPADEPSTSET